ncbi:tyrosine-type recombinase/integrase [Bacillus cereus]|nr:tyrosine-type recombinase/integrase [Bacillus cereus]
MTYLDMYKEHLKQEDKRESTIKGYEKAVRYFIQWYEENYSNFGTYYETFEDSIKDIRIDHLIDYRKYLLETTSVTGKPYSFDTISLRVNCIKDFFTFLYNQKLIEVNPAQNLKSIRYVKESQVKWLTKEEKATLLRYVEDPKILEKNEWRGYRNLAVVNIMLLAGLRISEVSELKLKDIEEGFILIRSSKGMKGRKLPINHDLGKILTKWLDVRNNKDKYKDSEYVFLSQRGSQFTEMGITKLFITLQKKTGISDLTAHTLRHTFCHDLVIKGVPVHMIAEYAGHSSLKTTMIYITSSHTEKKAAVEKLSVGRYDNL